jgi:P4 family phage/plasmid primase-like protien
MTSFKIYEIKSYNNWTNKRIENEFDEYDLDELINILQNQNKGYHQRIDPTKSYQMFGDCDKFRGSFNDFAKILIQFLNKHYNIQIKENDISYTENKSVNGSFHYSVPILYGSCKKLKEIHTNLLDIHKDTFIYDLDDKKQKVIDVSIYSKHWFRLPNQQKEQLKNTEHIIKRGNIEDFILGYIPTDSKCIDNYKFIDDTKIKSIKVKNKKINDIKNEIVLREESSDVDSENSTHLKTEKRGKFRELTKMEVKTLVNMLSEERYNYQDWLNVGMCLHNISDNYLDIWNSWSKKDKTKYKPNECKDKWHTFSGTISTNNGLNIGSLLMWAKEDNIDEFNKFSQNKKILDLVDKYRDIFPDNNLDVSTVITNEISHYVGLNDKYCPMAEEEHDTNSLYLEISPYEYVMKCHHCIGKKYPCKHIHLKEKELGQIFNMVNIRNIQNLNVTINNNTINDNQLLDEYSYEYENIFDDMEFNKLIFKSLNQTHFDVAMVFYNIIQYKFIFTFNNEWYVFNKNLWKKDNGTINMFLSKEFVDYYDKINMYYIQKRDIAKNEIDKKKYNLQITKISNLIKQLKTNNFKDNILKETGNIYNAINKQLNFDFENIVDNNPYIIGFNNGIYDLKKMEFREGTPSDYVSMSVGYDYNPEASIHMASVEQFFKDIQPEESERIYLLTFLSSLLEFNNPEEKFTIFSGKTRNGKTKLTDLISHTLGDYYGNIQSTMLTKERPSMDTPQPALINLNKKRVVSASEPEEEQSMNTGFIKGITGKDKFTSRYLYSNEMITFTLKFKLILLCNDKPKVNALNDQAFWNRCRCVEFPITFVENPTSENQKKIDEKLDEKMIHWKNDFFLLLLKYYKLYKENGLNPTNKVLQYTNKYKNENDYFKEFADQYIEKNENSFIIWTDLKDTFLDWFSENKGTKLPQTKQIKEYFEKNIFMEEEKLKSIKNNKIRGWLNWKLLN